MNNLKLLIYKIVSNVRVLSENYKYINKIASSLLPGSFRYSQADYQNYLDNIVKIFPEINREQSLKKYLLIESRILLEHMLMSRYGFMYSDKMVDRGMTDNVCNTLSKSTYLILSAHTTYYYTLIYEIARREDYKIAFVMNDPRRLDGKDIISRIGRESVNILEKKIPIIFPEDKNTVTRCRDYLNNGYSVFMLIDLPSLSEKYEQLSLGRYSLKVPTGFTNLLTISEIKVASCFTYCDAIDKPYKIMFNEIGSSELYAVKKGYVESFYNVLDISPESWAGWFYLHHMIGEL